MITAHRAIETHLCGGEKYPSRVEKAEVIGEFQSVDALYQHLRSELSVSGPRTLKALWGERGYIAVSLYDGESFAQDAAGRRIARLCD
jgi:hypothetical protein